MSEIDWIDGEPKWIGKDHVAAIPSATLKGATPLSDEHRIPPWNTIRVTPPPRVVPSGRSRPRRGPRLVYPQATQAATGRVLTPLGGLALALGAGCAFWALAILLVWRVLS